MKLASLKIQGFRCFGQEPVTVDFDDLTAFVGANGSGKTAVLIALARMFGTSNTLRTLTREDFHLPPDTEDPDELELQIDARFKFPECMEDEEADESTALPECLRNIRIEDSDDIPQCRIRLRATWTKTASPEGDIEQHLEWINSLEDEPPDDSSHSLGRLERSLIQVFYIPAARDAIREFRAVSGTILSRVLQHIEWPQKVKDDLVELSQKMADTLRLENAFTSLEKALRRRWKALRGSGHGKPELSVAETDLATLLRRIDPQLVRSKTNIQALTLLSEGEQSLLYFALVASALEFESKYLASENSPPDSNVPVLTILGVEEPENHLAPQYLSRILLTLRSIEKHRNAQVVITSHSASVLRRVEPTEIRHFRVDDDESHVISALSLPIDTEEAYKYVREALQTHPELYFARAVVLGEGPSEEVVLPRVAQAFDFDIDPSFVAVVPLGGRHVHHFWRLLRNLGTPFVTLLDLDMERAGGGWNRIHGIIKELLCFGEPPQKVHELTDEEFDAMPGWQPVGIDDDDLQSWLTSLEEDFGVFFSSPLDLDFMLLEAFPDAYKALAPNGGGPRRIPKDEPKRAKRIEGIVRAVLGDGGGDGSTYDPSVHRRFAWYSYLFVSGSKPVAHARAFSELDDDAIANSCPAVLKRLVDRVKKLVA